MYLPLKPNKAVNRRRGENTLRSSRKKLALDASRSGGIRSQTCIIHRKSEKASRNIKQLVLIVRKLVSELFWCLGKLFACVPLKGYVIHLRAFTNFRVICKARTLLEILFEARVGSNRQLRTLILLT